MNIWIRIGDRGPEGGGEGGQKQRTKKKKGLHIIVTFILLIIKIIQLIFKNDVNKMGLPRKKKMVEWYNKRLDKGILDFTVSADSDETSACVRDG